MKSNFIESLIEQTKESIERLQFGIAHSKKQLEDAEEYKKRTGSTFNDRLIELLKEEIKWAEEERIKELKAVEALEALQA